MENINGKSTNHTCKKVIPLWQVLLDNVPTLSMYILGAIIMGYYSNLLATVYVIYSLLSIVWFWRMICPYCSYYNTRGCPCGYGKISSFFFNKRDSVDFKKVFRRNIIFLFPSWFIPPVFGVMILINSYSLSLLIYLASFVVIGFILIPLISKLVGCKDCEIKEDCPWMK
jgi:hypothetical protein